MTRTKPMIIRIRLKPDDIPEVRSAYAHHFGEKESDATQSNIQNWFESIVTSELETVFYDMECQEEEEKFERVK